MGYMPIFKLVVNMSLPMIISMLVQALYNVVDSMFVSRVSENALTAVSLAFPAQNLMIGVATGTAVGVNALLSKSLGEKNYKRANQIAENGIFLSFIGFLIFLIFGLFGTEVFFRTQTDIEDIISSGVDYLRVCSCFSFGIFGQIIFERLMQSTGRTFYTMITQGVGAIINIVLDPIFIFGYFGLPAMGAKGAAVATVIGQIIAFIIAAILNKKKNTDIDLKLKEFRPNLKIIGRIYSIGIPSIIMVAVGSIMTFSINKIVIAFTETAAAVFGVYFKLQSFVFMPLFGMNNGVIPIIAYNYGARYKSRMLKTIKLSVIYAEAFSVFGAILFFALPNVLLGFFSATPQMLEIGIPALRIISLSFLFAGMNIALSAVFQAFGKSVFSMIMSFIRQLVVLIPAAYILARYGLSIGNNDLVWWSYTIAEISAVFSSVVFFAVLNKKTIKPLNEADENR